MKTKAKIRTPEQERTHRAGLYLTSVATWEAAVAAAEDARNKMDTAQIVANRRLQELGEGSCDAEDRT
jgi:hypothetical protein